MNITITSKNRTAAKRLLNNWHDSREVRTWPLSTLNFQLQRAINEGLITEQGAARALLPQSEWHDNKQRDGRHGEQQGERDHSNDDERDDDMQGDSGDGQKGDGQQGDEQEGDSQQGDGQQSGDDQEGDSQQGDSQQGDGDGDGDDEDGEKRESNGGKGDAELGDEDDSESKSEDSESKSEDEESDSEGESQQQQQQQQQDEEQQQDDGPLRHEMFPDVLAWIKAGVNVALVGPAGTGKSTIVGQCAEELGREFRGTGALMSKYDLVGYRDAGGVYHATPLYEAFTEGHLFCFDELDGSAPDAVVAFNAATDSQNVFAFPNGMQHKHEDFVAVACMNTWGNGASADYVGRYKQDAASMSRFVKVFIDYDRNIERVIAGKHTDIAQRVWDLREACSELGIRHVVSTRMIQQAVAGRQQHITKAKLDRDVLFAGLDDNAIKQLKTRMNAAKREREAAANEVTS